MLSLRGVSSAVCALVVIQVISGIVYGIWRTWPSYDPAAECSVAPQIRILQIGANDFDYRQANDLLQKWLAADWRKPPGIEAVLIEPNPHVFKVLEKNARHIFGNDVHKQIRLLNCAVCPKQSGTVTFWGVSPQFAIDFPDMPHWKKYQLSSLKKAQLSSHDVPAKYHEAMNVSCYTASEIIARAGYHPQDIDILYIDSEGFDAKILHSFLQVPSFSPAVIQFECKHLSEGGCKGPEMSGVGESLKKRTYVVKHDNTDVLVKNSYLAQFKFKSNIDLYRSACKTTTEMLRTSIRVVTVKIMRLEIIGALVLGATCIAVLVVTINNMCPNTLRPYHGKTPVMRNEYDPTFGGARLGRPADVTWSGYEA